MDHHPYRSRGGAVTAVGPSGTVRLPGDYERDHVELAYAQTGHAAQGRTVDYSLLLVDQVIDNRGVYVPMTRGKIENHAYVALDRDDPRRAIEVLAEAVTKDWADIPAIARREQLAQQPPRHREARAMPQPPLTPHALRHVITQLEQIDALNIPFKRGELARDLSHQHRAAAEHADAVAKLEGLRAERDRVAARLGAIRPWNPLAGRRRQALEHDNSRLNTSVHRARSGLERKRQQLSEANARVDQRVAWLETHAPALQQRPGLQAALDRDLNARARYAADHEPPPWAVRALGTRPRQPERTAVWDQAVGLAAQYRAAHAITDPEHTLGPQPGRLDPSHQQHARAAAAIGHANHQLGRTDTLSREQGRSRGLGISR